MLLPRPLTATPDRPGKIIPRAAYVLPPGDGGGLILGDIPWRRVRAQGRGMTG